MRGTSRKNYRFIVLLLACSVFAATPVLAASKSIDNNGMDNKKESQVVTYADLDPTIKKAAEEAIEQYGNGKNFKLERATKGEFFTGKAAIERWLVENKERSAAISIDAGSGKLLSISLTFAISELTGDYEKYLKTAQLAAKQLKADTPFAGARIDISNVQSNKRQTLNFFTKDEQFIELDLKTNKPTSYRFAIKKSNVDAKVMRAAEQAVKGLGSKLPFTHIERYTNWGPLGKGEIWDFKRKKEVKSIDRDKYSYLAIDKGKKYAIESQVVIDSKTGELISVFALPKTDNQKQVQLTQDKAVEKILPVVKKLFGIDLSTYQVKVDKASSDYTFSSGKQSIFASFDEYGSLDRMARHVTK
ncbi:hypothetical protein NQ117_11415 [Paenibacillus sp. SC116]|uniref:hypothetical protein n=1 Tax=Paenibacillus sp. SC116 TaxID=2968986 RepID=UPI00215AC093|nr:hypothetical protein [Paenibacillus sp. SC116]MCR8844294.1 hypothetical protein [Paenibacillus sp. SC116]